MRAFICAALLCFAVPAGAASFSYHGSLRDNGKPAEGKYDLELTLYSAAQGGQVVGGPITLFAVPVHAGSFNTEADFGPLTKAQNAWIDVSLRPAGSGAFSALGTRAAVSADSTASVCPGAWTLAGNAGNPTGSYLGTADNTSLIFKVNGLQAGSLIPSADVSDPDAPNVVFGASGNSAGAAVGATIAGGGSSIAGCGDDDEQPCINTANGEFPTVGGGLDNIASGNYSVVAGGGYNSASGAFSAVGGGAYNSASASWSTVGGGGLDVGEVGGPGNTASGFGSTVSGGVHNTASGFASTVSGGSYSNASGNSSTVAGGVSNIAAGAVSFAAGQNAHVRASDAGTFVWSDSTATSAPFTSTGANQFLINATGGMGIGTANLTTNGSTQAALTIQGFNTNRGTAMFCSPKGANCSHVHFGTTGDWFIRSAASTGAVTLQDSGGTVAIGNTSSPSSATILFVGGNAAKPGGGSWAVLSDARLKRNIADIADPLDRVLALHGVEFDYIPGSHTLEAPGRQIGFIAQDVEKVFPDWVGTGSDGYEFVAVHGFEALAVEAMRQLREEKDAQIADLHGQIEQLTARLERLEAISRP